MSQEATRFAGDRYQRLAQGARVLGGDPAVAAAPAPFNSASLESFVELCRRQRVLDGLSEDDADLASLLILVGFHQDLDDASAHLHYVATRESAVRRGDGRAAVDVDAVAKAIAAARATAEILGGAVATEG